MMLYLEIQLAARHVSDPQLAVTWLETQPQGLYLAVGGNGMAERHHE